MPIRERAVIVAAVLFVLCPAPSTAQIVVRGSGPDGRVRLHTSDLAIFVARQQRRDLPCSVSPNKPMLGFDLRFHASYEVAIPLRELAGGPNMLNVLFRVTPKDPPGEPVYFRQRIRVPEIEPDARGDSYLHGVFDVGEGTYQVDWLMRDHAGRVCSAFWEVDARLRGGDADIALMIRPGEVAASEFQQFRQEPPVLRAAGDEGLRIKVLVNFAPQNQHAATLQPIDTSALVAILRTISREPRISKFSVVAFNLQEQRVLFRQEEADQIDFPALGASLDTLELGTIDLARLSDQGGEARFLTELIQRELGSGETPDAVVFAGPKAMLDHKVPVADLKVLGEPPFPIFYMNYNLYPYQIPWRDAIGQAVKSL
ncbi:MAG TPA: acetyltransferase, partial [Bryobacterales bacterium]|nr:acetyltransferase [Bryobacterales bacterium]